MYVYVCMCVCVTSHHIRSDRIVSCQIISSHVISYRTVSHRIISYHTHKYPDMKLAKIARELVDIPSFRRQWSKTSQAHLWVSLPDGNLLAEISINCTSSVAKKSGICTVVGKRAWTTPRGNLCGICAKIQNLWDQMGAK